MSQIKSKKKSKNETLAASYSIGKRQRPGSYLIFKYWVFSCRAVDILWNFHSRIGIIDIYASTSPTSTRGHGGRTGKAEGLKSEKAPASVPKIHFADDAVLSCDNPIIPILIYR